MVLQSFKAINSSKIILPAVFKLCLTNKARYHEVTMDDQHISSSSYATSSSSTPQDATTSS
jgi:hypothetical protein